MPHAKAAANVGIIVDNLLQQHLLKTALMHFGFKVILTTDPSKMNDNPELAAEVDAWVVDIIDEDAEHLWLDDLFDGDVPVLFGMGEAPQRSCENYPRWEKRLFAKMKELLAGYPLAIADEDTLNKLESAVTKNNPFPLPAMFNNIELGLPAEHIWVLGASLGGPDAVKEFLDALPQGLPVGFIYAQHIDNRFQQALIQTLGRHAGITMVPYKEGSQINTGEVMLAPVEHEFSFDFEGRAVSKNEAWPGPYGPSVDQVMLNVAQHFGNRARYILFSGMGNDGAEAAVKISQQASTIWAQNSESCANSSMPDSVVATGHVSYIGSPRQLASQLVNYLQTQWMK
ncbi:MAG: chemotaxis protein CheB [Oleispira antarctica]|uniref:protein-glutamate methylesterase n=1 Tax=Oleispira antarctica RB-8 TaxID=698738 RepID=R4YJA1_OLEAN|nr:chemotaxis protein CheB [Oleispira antarctica]MBQ0791752.1 chemotaxis protein CheB [Oleispira antarctica]CCK74271.1 Chemotaxis response regulator containing a CheY-like receiver domain and a methylesterase domain [Oleispira antarctica RB-8]|tara:strand:+ start:970 stop:1995 length:1026 start_codon:yes stop_codon:yes gene_type:complete